MIILSLGSNLSSVYGDRFDNLNMAMEFLNSYQITVKLKSSFYETYAYPNKNDPKFINLAISVSTQLPPVDLRSVLIFIEEKLGRKRIKKNEPRTCDIDIIDYNGQVSNFSYQNLNLVLPHKELTSRNFVLYPLQEILPEWRHPINRENITNLIKALPNEDKNSILKIDKN